MSETSGFATIDKNVTFDDMDETNDDPVEFTPGEAPVNDPMAAFTREMMQSSQASTQGGDEEGFVDPAPAPKQKKSAANHEAKLRKMAAREEMKIKASWQKAIAKKQKEQLKHVEQTAAKVGEAVGKASVAKAKADVSDDLKRDWLRQIQQFRQEPFYCTPIVARLSIDSPVEIIKNELAHYKDELSSRRSAKHLEAIPGTVFGFLSVLSKEVKKNPKFAYVTDKIDLSDVDKMWDAELKDPNNADLKLVLAELYVTYGAYFKLRPEYVLLTTAFKVASKCNAINTDPKLRAAMQQQTINQYNVPYSPTAAEGPYDDDI